MSNLQKIHRMVIWLSNTRVKELPRRLLIFWLISLFPIQSVYSAEQPEEWIYTFTKGDNLWDITEKYLNGIGYWKQLQRLNNVNDPLHMPPGTEIRIPLHWLKVESTEATVRINQGDNFYIRRGKTEELPLMTGSSLHAGDQVVIMDGGNALLEFPDGSQLYLAESAELVLQRVNRFSDSGIADTQTLLEKGRSETRVKTKGTRFEIRTPAANTAVRGTHFRTSVDSIDSGISHVEVIEGTVGVSGAGSTKKLQAGFGTSVHPGEPPVPPVKLLGAPQISQPGVYSREFPVTFKWIPVSGASAYRLQIRNTSDNERTLLDTVIRKPAYSTNTLQDGRYTLLVRAINNNGLEGLETEHVFELDAQPQPPAVISPGHRQIVRTKNPVFEWSQPADADSFHIQLSRDPEFNNIVTEVKNHTATTLSLKKLEPGNYYWKLASTNSGEEGPFNQPLEFVLRPSPDAPEVSTEGNEQQLTIRWSLARKGQGYRLQIAKDESFRKMLIDEQLQLPEWKMERPKVPVFFRVQIIDIDGFQGAWSLPQQIAPPPLPWYFLGIPVSIFALLIAL